MIAQLFLSLLLLAMLSYALIATRRTRPLEFSIVLAAVAGLVFVWWPQGATELANLVGIGRGADLILYLWVVLSMLVGMNLHLRLKAQAELTTRLARKLALLGPGEPSTSPDDPAMTAIEHAKVCPSPRCTADRPVQTLVSSEAAASAGTSSFAGAYQCLACGCIWTRREDGSPRILGQSQRGAALG